MNRLLLPVAVAAAGALVAAPAVAGLSGNTSFSRDIRVPVPAGAHHVRLSAVPSTSHPTSTDSRRSSARSTGSEDKPGHDVASSVGTDDHGGLRSASSAGRGGADDHGGGKSADDRGSGGGHGGRH